MNMTVKELLKSVAFEEIASALRRTHKYDESIREMTSYKEAYDEICHTEFNGVGGEVTFNITYSETLTDNSLTILANNVEGDYRENTVGKTVVFPEDNHFTNAELAGAILWGMTFYGFSDLKCWFPGGDKILGKYGLMAKQLQRKLYLPYLRDKEEVKRLKRLDDTLDWNFSFEMETLDNIFHHVKHQNHSKRKRYYRIEKRIDYLERLDNREKLLSQLYEIIGDKIDIIYRQVMDAKKMLVDIRESRTYGEKNRTDYLAELITNYGDYLWEDCVGCDEVAVIVTTSPQNPATDEEKQKLNRLFSEQAFKLRMSHKLFYGTVPSLPDTEMNLHIIITQQ